MRSVRWCFLTLPLVLLGLTGCSPAQEKVRIGYLNITGSLPFFVAQELSYVEENGIPVEPVRMTSSNQLVDVLLTNKLDSVVETSAVPVFSAEIESPGRIKVFSVSEIRKGRPFDSLLVRKGSAIESLSDLEGTKIGVFPGSTATILLRDFLDDNNVSVSGIEFIEIPPTNQLEALQAGSIDTFHVYEPTTAIAKSTGSYQQIFGSVYAAMLEPNPQGVALVSAHYLSAEPRLAERVISVFDTAYELLNSNDDHARTVLKKQFDLTKEVTDQVVFLHMSTSNEINEAVLQRYIDMLHELGELPGTLEVENIVVR